MRPKFAISVNGSCARDANSGSFSDFSARFARRALSSAGVRSASPFFVLTVAESPAFPSPFGFFGFCAALLERYRDDDRIVPNWLMRTTAFWSSAPPAVSATATGSASRTVLPPRLKSAKP